MSGTTRQKKLVENMNLMDDTFFHKISEDAEACEEMLRVFLENPGLKIISSRPQYSLRNTGTRSVVLDALCQDSSGSYYNVEVQKEDDDDHQKRVRYNGSNIDTSVTEKGIGFADIPDVYVIYLSKFDLFHYGRTIYHIDRVIRENKQVVENGFHEIYINAAVDDGSLIAELMKYIKKTVGENRKFPRLSDRVTYFKVKKEGKNEMCETLEEYVQERNKEVLKKAAKEAQESTKELFRNGVALDLVLKSMKQLTAEEIKAIYEQVKKETVDHPSCK